MGRNLGLNMVDQGIDVTGFSISAPERHAATPGLPVCDSLAALVETLQAPRVLFLMVTAGEAVDQVITELLPLLQPGDVIIDGGNSHYLDTERRAATCRASNVDFLGVGISGGAAGARHGASVMKGSERMPMLEPLFAAIATHADDEPCYGWLGNGGAGHFVKTVHNGIEYGVMQLIAEAYEFLRCAAGLDLHATQAWFAAQTQGVLASYLMDITAAILAKTEGDARLIELVSDVAEQKGTGRWCVDAALTFGIPIPTIVAAVTERQLSNQLLTRQRLATTRSHTAQLPETWAQDLTSALHLCMLVTFAQGLDLIRAASTAHQWHTDLRTAIKLWRGGCIIRAHLLGDLLSAAQDNPTAGVNLLTADKLMTTTAAAMPALRRVATTAVACGVALPGMLSAVSYLDSLQAVRLPTHLIQAQRDCFGSHEFERIDRPGRFHVDWLVNDA